MKGFVFTAALIITAAMVSPGLAAGPQDQNAREAYKMILMQADTNKDGKLSVSECKGIYKDKRLAEKNCNFWDENKDGFITEAEYVKQSTSFGKKK